MRLVALWHQSLARTETSRTWGCHRLYLNPSERAVVLSAFCRDLSQQAILPGNFVSLPQLVDAIMQSLTRHNLNRKRYVWRAKGGEILAGIQGAEKRPSVRNNVNIILETHDEFLGFRSQNPCYRTQCPTLEE
jgi:hypothetical protein